MRRILFAVVGLLEILVAGLLLYIGLSLPRPSDVGHGFDRVEHTTRKASRQVGVLRRQVADVRQPQLNQFAEQLQRQTESIASTVRKQQVDFETIVQLRDALRDVSAGLDSAAETLDNEKIDKLGKGLGDTANYIDQALIPTATKSADQMDLAAADLSKDALQLARLLRDAPPDLRVARDIHDSLGKFDQGLEKMLQLLELKRVDTIREGFSGLETSLGTAAQQVEKLSGYKYPSVRISGLKVEVEERPFWPNSDKIADGLRKATEGVRAAQKEMDGLVVDLPKLRLALEESRKVVAQTRSALGQALQQQQKLEPLLRDIPNVTAKLAEQLPKLLKEFSRVLRETKQLKELAESLRQAQRSIDAAVARWPEFRLAMKRTAELLRTSSNQLERAVQHRADYESAVKQNTDVAESFARSVPIFTRQLTTQLEEQEASLRGLEVSLEEMGDTIPDYKQNAMSVVGAGRLLSWLIATIVAFHGIYVIADGKRSLTSSRPN